MTSACERRACEALVVVVCLTRGATATLRFVFSFSRNGYVVLGRLDTVKAGIQYTCSTGVQLSRTYYVGLGAWSHSGSAWQILLAASIGFH